MVENNNFNDGSRSDDWLHHRQMERQSMKALKIIIASLVLAIAIVGVSVALPPETRTQSAIAAFDHSTCQYPDRTTNPANGCDNSDPCDPSDAVKGGSGDCTPTYTQPTVQPPTPEPQTVTPAQPQVAQCGAK